MDHQQFDYIIRMMNCALQVSHVMSGRYTSCFIFYVFRCDSFEFLDIKFLRLNTEWDVEIPEGECLQNKTTGEKNNMHTTICL